MGISVLSRIRDMLCSASFRPWLDRTPFRSILRKAYYKLRPLAVPKLGRKSVRFLDLEATFLCRDAQELELVETPLLDKGSGGEAHILRALLESLRPGDSALDVGANIGVHAIFMAKKAGERGKVYAVEPEPTTCGILRENVRLNRLKNVVALPLAFGAATGEGELSSGMTARNAYNLRGSGQSLGQRVQIMRGDDLFRSRGWTVPAVVKIDVEGFEGQVLEGLRDTIRQSECRIICCEVHPELLPSGVTLESILAGLSESGFARLVEVSRGRSLHLIAFRNS